MNYFIELITIALFAVGCQSQAPSNQTDPNAHFVESTDICESLCEYYGKVCTIEVYEAPYSGYDCNQGYCRPYSGSNCVPVPTVSPCAEFGGPNTYYVENTDPCASGCRYYGEECPIHTFAPTGPGYDCKERYCRPDAACECVHVPREPCVGSPGPNTNYVENTDPCESECKYYGEQCPIRTLLPTGPGYDCKRGHCRLDDDCNCVAVPRNSHYVESTDACQSLCKYDSGCPIRPIDSPPPGFNCNAGYCRRTPESQCIRSMCYIREF